MFRCCVFALLLIVSSTGCSSSSMTNDSERGFADREILLTNVTISRNRTYGDFSSGGGVYGQDLVTVINSTITGNSTQGLYAGGGGVTSVGYGGVGISLIN